MKSYTDLALSKKLAEILPLESADMGWNVFVDDTTRILPINDWDLVKDGSGNVKFYHAWSLTALLGVLPKSLMYTPNPTLDGYCCKNIMHDLETYGSNPIDACYEMVLKLHKMNLL